MDLGFGEAVLLFGGLLAVVAALSGLMKGTVLSASVLFPALTNRGDALVPLALAGLALSLYTILHPGARRARVDAVPVDGPS